MIILGLILVLLAVVAGILLFEGTSALTDRVDIDILNGTIGLPPLALLITGAAVISVFWLGWALLRLGMKRGSRRRRQAKEEAALAEQRRADDERRMQEEFAQRERQHAEERRRHEAETASLRRQGDERGHGHLSSEESRRHDDVADGTLRDGRDTTSGPGGAGTTRDPGGPGSTHDPRDPRDTRG